MTELLLVVPGLPDRDKTCLACDKQACDAVDPLINPMETAVLVNMAPEAGNDRATFASAHIRCTGSELQQDDKGGYYWKCMARVAVSLYSKRGTTVGSFELSLVDGIVNPDGTI